MAKSAPGFDLHRIFCDDEASLGAFLKSPTPIVLSPGPGSPADYPRTLSIIQTCLGQIPIMGICLGHQILGYLHGSQVYCAPDPHHGSTISLDVDYGDQLFKGVTENLMVATYNSLVISEPNYGRVIARSADDGTIQAVSYNYLPATYGVQFHPESFLSRGGTAIMSNWVRCFSIT